MSPFCSVGKESWKLKNKVKPPTARLFAFSLTTNITLNIVAKGNRHNSRKHQSDNKNYIIHFQALTH